MHLETILLYELPVEIFELFTDIRHEHPRLDLGLHVLAHLPMALGGCPQLLVRDVVQTLTLTHLGRGDPRAV